MDVLFLCTGNSARSILAEALLNARAQGRLRAHSAGSHPRAQVNPLALEVLRTCEIDATGLRSKSWDEFATLNAPKLNFVFTVCDNAAREVCPVWPGQPISAHWGVSDPAAVQGSEDQVRRAFREAFLMLDRRIDLFLSLPLSSLDSLAIKKEVDNIGRQ